MYKSMRMLQMICQVMVACGTAPITVALGQSLDELKDLYADKLRYIVNREVVTKDGAHFIVTCIAAPSCCA